MFEQLWLIFYCDDEQISFMSHHFNSGPGRFWHRGLRLYYYYFFFVDFASGALPRTRVVFITGPKHYWSQSPTKSGAQVRLSWNATIFLLLVLPRSRASWRGWRGAGPRVRPVDAGGLQIRNSDRGHGSATVLTLAKSYRVPTWTYQLVSSQKYKSYKQAPRKYNRTTTFRTGSDF